MKAYLGAKLTEEMTQTHSGRGRNKWYRDAMDWSASYIRPMFPLCRRYRALKSKHRERGVGGAWHWRRMLLACRIVYGIRHPEICHAWCGQSRQHAHVYHPAMLGRARWNLAVLFYCYFFVRVLHSDTTRDLAICVKIMPRSNHAPLTLSLCFALWS